MMQGVKMFSGLTRTLAHHSAYSSMCPENVCTTGSLNERTPLKKDSIVGQRRANLLHDFINHTVHPMNFLSTAP